MSRDMKASCTDCQGHAEAVPFASSFPVDAIRDELNEPERPVSSFIATTCASDTDEGDYETSSEGMVLSRRSNTGIHETQAKESLCVYFKEKSASLSKRAAFDGNVSSIKGEVISDPLHKRMVNRLAQKTTYNSLILMSENLAQSKSLPILKSEISSGVSTDFTTTTSDVALISASSSAHKRKMSMIIKRIAPLISPYPSMVSLATNVTTNFHGRRHETRTTSPILCDATLINDGRSEELVTAMTFHETKNNRTMNWDPRQDEIPTFVNDEGAANVINDLVDVARNSYSSIKSVYFPPNPSLASPYDFSKSKRHQRMSTDVETLLKIDHELSPLRYQYSEIIGKARALGLSRADFDHDICRRNRPDTFQSALSPSVSDYFPDCGQTYPRRATISSGIKNRSVLVDKTSPSSTFSIVGKPISRGSRSSWLNENGSNCRQEALSFTIRDPSYTFENFDGPRFSSRVRNSISYFPTTNSHAFQRENVIDDRNECVSNSDFPCYKSQKAVRAFSAWDGWLTRGTVNTNPSNIFNMTEYNSHRYLNQAMEDSRTATKNSFEIRRWKSLMSVVEVTDNNWSTVDGRTVDKRSNEHSEIPSGNQNSMVVEMEFVSRGSNYESILPETECVAKDDEIPSSSALKSIDPDVDLDHRIRVVESASACAPQIRVVSVNTEFRATVEKHYTNRAVSPIHHPRLTTVSSTTTRSNVLLAAKVSSIFMQQVRADSSKKEAETESLTKICSIVANKQDVLANAASKRDFCVQKVDSRPVAENLSRLPEFKRDETDLTTTKFRETQYLRLPRANEKITIVPIVLTDGISEPSRIADVDFAIPKYAVKTASKLSYQIASFDVRKFRREMSSSLSRDNTGHQSDISEFADEKRWRTSRTSVSRVNRHTKEDYLPSTSITGKRPTGVKQAREHHETGRQRIVRTLPGIRSTPEDFLCET